MSIHEEIDLMTALRAEANAKDDYRWAVTQWRSAGRERDKLKERVAELEGVADHADFFPYLREMFERVDTWVAPAGPRLKLEHDDLGRAPDEFAISGDFRAWLAGIRDSIPADPPTPA